MIIFRFQYFKKILAIDPSGTGTTGIFLKFGEQFKFLNFKSKNWKEHFNWIIEVVKFYQPNVIVYEINNYVGSVNRGRDIINLLKLFGAIETLAYYFADVKVYSIPAKKTQHLKEQIKSKTKVISGVDYRRGMGWTYDSNKIIIHELDAFFTYWIWKSKNYYE